MKATSRNAAELMKKMIFILLLFISLTCSVCETFEVRSAQSFYQVLVNKNVTLEWTFTKSPLDSLNISCSVNINGNESNFLIYDKRNETHLPGLLEGRVQLDKDLLRDGTIRLNVSFLRPKDSGVYRCNVTASGELRSASCTVNVTETFKVECARRFDEVFKNENVTLEWTFTDSPLDTFYFFCSWFNVDKHSFLFGYYNGSRISPYGLFEGQVQWDNNLISESRIRLYVNFLRPEESGNYTCEVVTGEGFDSASCPIPVTEPKTKTETGPEDRNTRREVWISLILIALIALICGFIFLHFYRRGLLLRYCHREKTDGGSADTTTTDPADIRVSLTEGT